MTLALMSFNIRTGRALDGHNRWARRRSLAIETIRSCAAAVVGLQEAHDFQLDEILEGLAQYRASGLGREARRDGERVPVLYTGEVLEGGDFWLSERPDEPGSVGWDAALPRICTWVRLRHAGREVVVANTHFDHHGEQARLHSVDVVVERVRAHGVPTVVMGDLNAAEASDVLSGFAEAGYRDTFRVRHPHEPGGTWHGFGAVEATTKIDYILADRSWEVVDAAIVRETYGGRYASDHFPVTATLRLAAP